MNDQALWSTIEQDGNLLIDLLERTFDIPSRSIEEEPPLVAELEIPMHGLTIEGQLLSLGLDEATAKAVDQNYIRSLHRIATDLQRNYSKTCHTLKHDQGSPAESDLASLALRRVHQESFKRCADDLWLDIAAAVRDQRLPQDGTEDQPFTDEARERLERIFQRRDKLNTAEKKEIALQCNLSPRQVSIWFANHRQRRKQYGTIGAARKLRKTSNTTTASSKSSASSSSSISLSSSTSSDAASATPSTPPLLSCSPGSVHSTLSRSSSWSSIPSPASIDVPMEFPPFPVSPLDQQKEQDPFSADATDLDDLLSQIPDPLDPSTFDSYSQEQPTPDLSFPSQPEFSLSEPTPLAEQFSFQALDFPDLSSSAALTDLDVDAGIGSDFWQGILQATGLSANQLHVGQQNDASTAELPSLGIAPNADDWSHVFGNLDFSGFLQQ